jgi:hypothetical protein
MGDTLRKVDYFYVMVPDTPGQGAKIMAGLADAGVNLLAFSGFPSARRAQLDLMPEDSAKLKRAAKKLGLTLSAKKTGFLYQGKDRVGAMTGILDQLAGAKINVVALAEGEPGGSEGGKVLGREACSAWPDRPGPRVAPRVPFSLQAASVAQRRQPGLADLPDRGRSLPGARDRTRTLTPLEAWRSSRSTPCRFRARAQLEQRCLTACSGQAG